MAQTIGTSNKVDVWADDGTVVEPASSKVDVGWQLGEQPPHEFMNWLQNTFGQKINHVLQHGVPRWNDATEYGVGDFVTHNDQLYRAINVNTNSEPPSGNWEKVTVEGDLGTAAVADIGDDPGDLTALGVATQADHDSPSGVEKLARLDRMAASDGFDFDNMPLVGGVPVVANGSNSDGEWTRWANGTQIVSKQGLGGANVGAGGSRTDTFSYPQPFLEIATCLINCGTGGGADGGADKFTYGVQQASDTTATSRCTNRDSSSRVYNFGFIATGIYK